MGDSSTLADKQPQSQRVEVVRELEDGRDNESGRGPKTIGEQHHGRCNEVHRHVKDGSDARITPGRVSVRPITF